MDFLQYILAFVVTLGVLVIIHEYGHYLIARASGVHVVRFAVGFGPLLWSKVDRRGTEFALCLVPLGGYVRMHDERDPQVEAAPTRPPGTLTYAQLHPRWRVAIALGGPVANFLLALVVYWCVALIGGWQTTPVMAAATEDSPAWAAGMDRPQQILAVDDTPVMGWQDIGLALTDRLGETGAIRFTVRDLQTARQQILDVAIDRWHAGDKDPDVFASLGLRPAVLSVVGDLVPDAAAAQAGLRSGDFVTAVNDVPVTYWQEWVTQIEAYPGARVVFDIYRDGNLRQVPVTIGRRTTDDGAEVGVLGVYQARTEVKYGALSALGVAVERTWGNIAMIGTVLKKMVTGQVSVENLSGPISIAQVAGDSAGYGWRPYLGILAFLSLSLGVMNLLPIPILDGGHVVFNSVEWMTGRPVPERVQLLGAQVGLFVVGTTMLLALYNDILRVF